MTLSLPLLHAAWGGLTEGWRENPDDGIQSPGFQGGSVLTGCITFAGNLFSASVHSPHSFEMEVMPSYLHTGLLYSSDKTIRMKGLAEQGC